MSTNIVPIVAKFICLVSIKINISQFALQFFKIIIDCLATDVLNTFDSTFIKTEVVEYHQNSKHASLMDITEFCFEMVIFSYDIS